MSPTPRSGSGPRGELLKLIQSSIEVAKFEGVEANFISPNILEELVKTEKVREIVKRDWHMSGHTEKEREDFVEWIVTQAPRMFIVVIKAGLLLNLLCFFHGDGINDKQLPFSKEQVDAFFAGDSLTDNLHCFTDVTNAAQTDMTEEEKAFASLSLADIPVKQGLHDDFDQFRLHQYIVPSLLTGLTASSATMGATPPPKIYTKKTLTTFVHDQKISSIPIKTIKKLAIGHGSTVYQARIATSCHNIQELQDDNEDPGWSNLFALKVLSPFGPHDQAKIREIDFIRKLSRFNVTNERISKTFGMFEIMPHVGAGVTQVCIINELATTDLEYFMSTSEPIDADWLQGEMKGLASALDTLHFPAPGVVAIHHAIRLENILVFDKPNGQRILKFTDFGVAAFQEWSGEHDGPLNNWAPFDSFDPPERRVREKTSRPHDVWSLGCVFTVMMIWANFNDEIMDDFLDRIAKNDRKTAWYRRDKGQYPMLCAMKYPVSKMLDDLTEVNEGRWSSVLKTVRKMFVMDPTFRITAKEVAEEL